MCNEPTERERTRGERSYGRVGDEQGEDVQRGRGAENVAEVVEQSRWKKMRNIEEKEEHKEREEGRGG